MLEKNMDLKNGRANDLKYDNPILWGTEKQDKQFKNTQSHLDTVKHKNGNDNIAVTGHSLGDSIPEQLAKSNPKMNSIAFDHVFGSLQQFRKDQQKITYVSNNQLLFKS